MRAALIGAVDFNEDDFRSRAFDLVVAVDAGWQTCKDAHLDADVVIGDFDSLGSVPTDVPYLQYPCEKNESDMELACRYALEQGADEVYLYGAFSGRLDHTMANIQVASAFARLGLKVTGIGSDFALLFLAAGPSVASSAARTVSFAAFDPSVLEGGFGAYLSAFSLAGPVQGLAIEGLAFEVSGFTLSPDSSRGLSNRFTGQAASIVLEQGSLVVVCALGALAHAVYGS